MNSPEEAEKAYSLAVEGLEKSTDSSHPDSINTLVGIGSVQNTLKK
jgi:hypothetical protein